MLIETKARDPKPNPDEASRFDFADGEKKSRLPIWVTLTLTGVFAYFRAFAGSHESHAAEAPLPAHSASDAHARSPGMLSLVPALADPEEGWDEPSRPLATANGWDDGLILSADQIFVFDSYAGSPRARWREFFSVPHLASPGNDNGGRPASAAGTGGSRPMHNAHPAGPARDPGPAEATAASGAAASGSGPGNGRTNRAPVVKAPVRLHDVLAGQVMLLTLGDLLLGAHDADGDELHATHVHASVGQVVAAGDGWAYINDAPGERPVTLSYEVDDGRASVHQTATFNIVSQTPAASAAATASDGSNAAPAPSDSGPAQAALGITAAPGDQNFREGDDGLAGDDLLFGDAGNNILRGGAGDDEIHGDAGNDVISGASGNDRIFGDAGNDILDGGEGDDIMSGGDGNDLIADGSGDDQIDGGEGEDVLDLSATTLGVLVDLDTGAVSGVEIGSDTIAGIEQVLGGAGDDIFVLGAESVQIVGGDGDDLYEISPDTDYVLVLVGDTAPAESQRHMDIVDFEVGDLLRVGSYEIRETRAEEPVPQFDSLYADTGQDDAPPIKTRDDHVDDFDVTIIEADLDRDGTYEVYVSLRGLHDLHVEHPIA
ncbi:MAG: hypothetical protein JWQ89_2669 [Devosia sp.]|uniref:calcium-binding protein n=1 Tax=Devosia sp. TaxID=1871048 RepID=UPI00263714B3|nr:cadherin-like domain-containing protein [Devosia sp.]MDB5540942.1 hypothetical protein [Devosia sp.]